MSSNTPSEAVEKLAALARIAIPEDRKEALAREFDSILAYIGQLEELDIAPGGTLKVPALHNVFRDDVDPTPSGTYTEDIVRAFPAASDNALSVKKIISHD